MKIHHVEETLQDTYVLDPALGRIVNQRKSVLSPSAVVRMAYGGETYQVGKDGAFEVPEEVGKFFLLRPGWHEGPGLVFPDVDAQPKPQVIAATVHPVADSVMTPRGRRARA